MHSFIFTSPANVDSEHGNVFAGFLPVAQTEDVVLLETGNYLLNNYLDHLREQKFPNINPTDRVASIVVNCNPFTRGHQYLIEKTASENDFVYVLVVTTDRSSFPTAVRLELIKKGTAHLSNVKVIEGGDYIISPATFPRYFMKEYDNVVRSQARLDVTIFAEHIAPALGITARYVGEEPYCPVTREYNKAMKEILSKYQIDFKIIPRVERDGQAISASRVRTLIRENKLEDIRELVPASTYDFLVSDDPRAQSIIRRIQNSQTRH